MNQTVKGKLLLPIVVDNLHLLRTNGPKLAHKEGGGTPTHLVEIEM